MVGIALTQQRGAFSSVACSCFPQGYCIPHASVLFTCTVYWSCYLLLFILKKEARTTLSIKDKTAPKVSAKENKTGINSLCTNLRQSQVSSSLPCPPAQEVGEYNALVAEKDQEISTGKEFRAVSSEVGGIPSTVCKRGRLGIMNKSCQFEHTGYPSRKIIQNPSGCLLPLMLSPNALLCHFTMEAFLFPAVLAPWVFVRFHYRNIVCGLLSTSWVLGWKFVAVLSPVIIINRKIGGSHTWRILRREERWEKLCHFVPTASWQTMGWLLLLQYVCAKSHKSSVKTIKNCPDLFCKIRWNLFILYVAGNNRTTYILMINEVGMRWQKKNIRIKEIEGYALYCFGKTMSLVEQRNTQQNQFFAP